METPECPGYRALQARVLDLEAQILALQMQLHVQMDKLKPPTPQSPKPLPPGPAKKATGKKPGGRIHSGDTVGEAPQHWYFAVH